MTKNSCRLYNFEDAFTHPLQTNSQISSLTETELLTVLNLGLYMNTPFFPVHRPLVRFM